MPDEVITVTQSFCIDCNRRIRGERVVSFFSVYIKSAGRGLSARIDSDDPCREREFARARMSVLSTHEILALPRVTGDWRNYPLHRHPNEADDLVA